MDRTRLVADERFSSHQARLMLHMGLRSLNVTYPTSSADEKDRKANGISINLRGIYPPTPPPNPTFALRGKPVLMLGLGRGRCEVCRELFWWLMTGSLHTRQDFYMGLRSLNVTYPTSSAENKKAERLGNSLVANLTIISKEIPNIQFFYSLRVSSPIGETQDWRAKKDAPRGLAVGLHLTGT